MIIISICLLYSTLQEKSKWKTQKIHVLNYPKFGDLDLGQLPKKCEMSKLSNHM